MHLAYRVPVSPNGVTEGKFLFWRSIRTEKKWNKSLKKMKPQPPRRPSYAEQKRKNQSTMELYAALAGKERVDLAPVRPRREYAPKNHLFKTEHQEQVSVIAWWRHACLVYQVPEYALFAIPNGGSRGVVEAVNLKSEGLRSGVPDLFLSVPRYGKSGLFLEMKIGKNTASENQKEFILSARLRGYEADVFWSSDDAINAIKNYMDRD